MKTRRQILIAAIIVIIIVSSIYSVCFIDSFRYPRIVRGALWRRPHLLVTATLKCYFPCKGVTQKYVSIDAMDRTGNQEFEFSLLYLPNIPKNNKSIQARFFNSIAKNFTETSDDLFWVVSPKGSNSIDDTLVYEYKSGRLACSWN